MEQKCKVDGCQGKVKSKGMCKLHYQRFWRIGSAEVSRPCLHGTTEQRFWNHVTIEDGCWNWEGFKDKDGYGKLRDGSANVGAHRISYEIHKGKIPNGFSVLHKCNNPSCCNPDHLYLGDHNQNMVDRKRSGNYASNERHHYAKFSNDIVQQVLIAKGTYKQIGGMFGMSPSQVCNIKKGRQRKQDN